MKREFHHHPTTSTSPTGKGKMWDADPQQDAGMDELLAVLGYNVKASDMAVVAQKLEQLEEVIGNAPEDGLSHLASETVHYNPSDLCNWLESMLSEFNPASNCSLDNPFLSPISQSSPAIPPLDYTNCSTQPKQEPSLFDSPAMDYDLKAIPGKALYSHIEQQQQQQQPPPPPPPLSQQSPAPAPAPAPAPSLYQRESKRLKPTTSSTTTANSVTSAVGGWGVPTESARPVVLVDSQETGIRLVHTLMACAEAVQQENMKLAEALVKQIGFLAVSQAGAMRKVATYFAEGLARRIYRLYPDKPLDTSFSDILQMHFYETCPYLKFAHFTANQAILEAFDGKKRVHVIDFSMKQGMQWPALMQALALRPGGPPTFRLTGIGPPSTDNTDHLHEVGWKLAQLAETIHVEFEYRGFVANSLADLDASMLELREGESVAVNSVFELHGLLARPGGIERVLSAVKDMKPEILTIVEQEANHNGPVFLDRFTESLHYYSTLFDSLEGCGVSPANTQDKLMSEVYLGQQICNVVACEGGERVERHETLAQWRARLGSAGFDPVNLGSNAFKQASMLLALFAGGDGYRVEENNGCLMLGWHTRPLIATSAWQLANKPPTLPSPSSSTPPHN